MEYHSFWEKTEMPRFPEQSENINCSICIVGCGLCGLLIAYELLDRGVDPAEIVLIDAKRVGSGTTSHSTAKLTAQHGLIYDRLVRQQGVEKAFQYAKANESGVLRAQEIAKKLRLKSIQKLPSHIYATTTEQRESLEREAKAARALGFDVDLTVECELPFPVEGALRFEKQAALNPAEFVKALVQDLTERGCTIYENTKALYPEKNVVVTDKGKIFAEKVVISTRFPFADKHGLFFAKLYQQRSYLLLLNGTPKINGCYVGAQNTGLSFRPYRDQLLLCGTADEEGRLYTGFYDLIRRVVDLYPDCEVVEKWSGEDCMTHDGIPYIGRYKALPGEMYLATGFNKWGISTSFAAGQILADQITRGYSEYEDVFSPSRSLVSGGMKSLFVRSAEIATEFVTDLFHNPKKSAKALAPGESAVVSEKGKKICACRDERGLHQVVHRCTHMNCPLEWNGAEQVWDCPCHGSRFDVDGQVISGPAQRDLDQIKEK